MREIIEKYKNYLKYSGKSERTIYLYALRVEDFLRYINKDPMEITKDDIIEYYMMLENKKKYSKRSLYTVGWSLKSFFQMIGRNDIVMWIPTPSFTVVEEPAWIPMDRIECVIDEVPYLCVAYDLALRLREVGMLRRDRYNPKTGEIEVYRLKKKGKPVSQILVLGGTDPKTNAREVLNKYLETRTDSDKRMFNISDRMMQYKFKQRIKICGLDPNKYSFHRLRHSRLTHIAIYELQNKGYVDIVSLAKFAGHGRPETTMMYVHLAHKYLAFSSNT